MDRQWRNRDGRRGTARRLAAGAVVVKPVAPYEVVGGNLSSRHHHANGREMAPAGVRSDNAEHQPVIGGATKAMLRRAASRLGVHHGGRWRNRQRLVICCYHSLRGR